jgi:hypothetical protein
MCEVNDRGMTMKRALVVCLSVAAYLIAADAQAVDFRMFQSWTDEKLERLADLESKINSALKTSAPARDILPLFTEYTALLEQGEDLLVYLSDTADLAAHITDDSVLDLRNRLDNIYQTLMIRLDPTVEERVLRSLEQAATQSRSVYVRMEAVMALGAVGNPSALPTLERACNDSDDSVRRYASEAIRDIEAIRESRYSDPTKISYRRQLESLRELFDSLAVSSD